MSSYEEWRKSEAPAPEPALVFISHAPDEDFLTKELAERLVSFDVRSLWFPATGDDKGPLLQAPWAEADAVVVVATPRYAEMGRVRKAGTPREVMALSELARTFRLPVFVLDFAGYESLLPKPPGAITLVKTGWPPTLSPGQMDEMAGAIVQAVRMARPPQRSQKDPAAETERPKAPPRATKADPTPVKRAPSPPRPTYARIDSDAPAKKDLIGIERDVLALTTLVCAKEVSPPLSIGLFGDWGSGKSFFMREMRDCVEVVAEEARKAQAEGRPTAFHGRVAQIEFNAWHYVEGNLWASLVEHIFRNLTLSSDRGNDAEARRRAVAEKLEEARTDVKKRQRELERAREERRAVLAELEEARREAAAKRMRLDLLRTGVLAAEFAPRGRVTDADRVALARLGVPPEALATTKELGAALSEAEKKASGLAGAARGLWKDGRAWREAAPAVLVGVAVAGGVLALDLLAPQLPLNAFWEAASGVASGAAVALRRVNAEAGRIQAALDRLQALRRELEAAPQAEETLLDGAAATLEARVKQKEAALADSEKKVQAKELELASLAPAQALSDFIESRAKGDDYRKHLGLVALVRSDFEQLSSLMGASAGAASEKDGPKVEPRHRVDRIVLYVDDLDRCPPERVVEVLQAIHLLLAFPLFTVVVAVDARWVDAALERRYREQLRAEGTSEEKQLPLASGRGVATPHDYLEKIFQVPFWVPPMTDEASRKLLAGLLDGEPAPRAVPVQGVDAPALEAPPVPGLAGAPGPAEALKPAAGLAPLPNILPAQVMPDPAQAVPPTPKAERVPAPARKKFPLADVNPESLTLSGPERAFMDELTPLVGRTPRALKRFVNCYRILHARLAPDDPEAGEEAALRRARRVLVMLAIVVGAPDRSREIFDKLRVAPPSMPFFDWLQELLPEQDDQDDDWRRVARTLSSQAVQEVCEETVERFVEDLPLVARYSFNLDPLGAHR